ncbi:hypothetical protein FE782_31815 [Paenibacillus antri]|uniref:Uncharacterized protein n=1 Tax=Paenibacillus antri TaxID=2582848 RepID=A0A5R9G403_9BACL|nr:hypothetical protein [Paenibacillus antri]TLS48228.1 hypothetical protein FE782_31815 [Paenibacillus antri]
MRSIKTVFPVVVLESLWASVEVYAKATKEREGRKTSVSQLFEQMAVQLCEEPLPLPIVPNRRVTIYQKAGDFGKEFPQARNSLYLDPQLLERLFRVYEEVAKKQFGEETTLNTNTLATTVFYYFCRERELPIDEKYFDDDYFRKHYSYSDEQTLEAIRNLTIKLGKEPTSREWRQMRQEVGGPSESYIVNRFGSFNVAKRLAQQTLVEGEGNVE